MRVNPDTTADMLALIEASKQRETRALAELSTGLRVSMPSDDPAAAATNVQITAQSSNDDQFLKSISSTEQSLNMADSTLSSVVTALTSAISLGVEGANGTESAANREAVAAQVSDIQQQVMNLANTSYAGQYLFGGTVTANQPYTTAANGSITFQGNNQVNTVQIGNGQTVAINSPGPEIFNRNGADVFAALANLVTQLKGGTSDQISSATTQLRTTLDGVNAGRVFYGSTVKQLEAQESFLNRDKLNLSSYQNDLVGADATAAASEVQQAAIAQEATLQAYAKTAGLSLLNYLPTSG